MSLAERLRSGALPYEVPDHYATLGLHRRCTDGQIRTAYRLLAKQHHPDVNGDARGAVARTQALNAAYEILSDPRRRKAYDRELRAADPAAVPKRSGRIERNVSEDMLLRIDEFLRGTTLTVRVNDPGNAGGAESYELIVPPGAAPGSRLRVPREGGGVVTVRLKAMPDARFKVRGSDLRCDLRINARRAAEGGAESLRGVGGNQLRVEIPGGIASGETIRIPDEGLPRPRGGRGDLLVRVTYRPEVRITRSSRR